MRFVDTNIFLRLFLRDHPQQSKQSAELFKKAKNGKIKLWTTEWVIGEIIWTLASYYDKPTEFIIDTIKKIINTEGLEIHSEGLVVEALGLYEKERVDFEDAMNSLLAREEGVTMAYSYDKHFDRIPWLKRKSL